jgi:hypothetical protein
MIIIAVALIGATLASPASAATPVNSVEYQPQADGSWKVVKGDWKAIPSINPVSVTVVLPKGSNPSAANVFADNMRTTFTAGDVQTHKASKWRGNARVIISWA